MPDRDGIVRPAMTYIADMQHFLDVLLPGAQVAPAARRMGEYLGSIVAAASLAKPNLQVKTSLRCRRRPNRRQCPGHIRFRVLPATNEIVWECAACADNGIIHNWRGTLWDFSRDLSSIH